MVRKIEVPIFHGALILYQDFDFETACKRHGLISDNVCDAVTGQDTDISGHIGYIMIFNSCTPAIIAHEAVHVAFRILESHGIAKDEEVMAYLVGWVTAQCYKYLRLTK